MAETRADWATAATFSSHPRRCQGLGRPGEGPTLRPFPGREGQTRGNRERQPEGDSSCREKRSPCFSFSLYVCHSLPHLNYFFVSVSVRISVSFCL